MPFVEPLESCADPEISELAKFFNETLGFCPNSVLTMSRRPAIAKAFIQLNMAVMENNGRVTSGLKRLIAFVSSNVAGCRYCQAHTIRAAERYGARKEQIENIWDFATHPSFTAAERVALELSLAASSVPNKVDRDLQSRVRQHWNDGEIVEILGVIALFGYLNRWNDSMGTTLEQCAIESADTWLTSHGWQAGKHVKTPIK